MVHGKNRIARRRELDRIYMIDMISKTKHPVNPVNPVE
jgi:hypothetical protein